MSASSRSPPSSSRPNGHDGSANANTIPSQAHDHQHVPRHRVPRSLPPWIDSYEAGLGSPTQNQLRTLEQAPPRVLSAHHHHAQSEPERRLSRDGFVHLTEVITTYKRRRMDTFRRILTGRGGAGRGRKWDHLRTAEPVIVPKMQPNNAGSHWVEFWKSSEYGHLPNEKSEVVHPDMLDKLQPGFNRRSYVPRPLDESRTRKTRTTALYKRIWRLMLTDPFVPLVFRLTVLLSTIIALALSAKIFRLETHPWAGITSELTQAIVAIVIDSVAIPYIGYMTWDEYTGKPLGLRPATQKISLVLMDLFFIIFKSASTTLAFEALVYHNSREGLVLQYSRALAAFQTVSLISWCTNFIVNIFRLVHRLGGGEEESMLRSGRGHAHTHAHAHAHGHSHGQSYV